MAPRKRARTVVEEDANDGVDAQEDGTPDIDDEGLASILNTNAMKRNASATRSHGGTWVQRLTFGLVGGVTSDQGEHIAGNRGNNEEDDELQEDADPQSKEQAEGPIDEQDGRKQDAEFGRADDYHEEDRSATSTRTSPISISRSKRKRDGVGDVPEEREESPRKRITRARKARLPIVAPKTSLGDHFNVSIRASREKQLRKATIEKPTSEQQPPPKRSRGRPKNAKPDAEVSEPKQPPAVKKRKGRPTQNPTPKPQSPAEEASRPQVPTSQSPADEEYSSPSTPIASPEIPLEVLGTVSPILESPSPQKKSPVKLTRKDVGLPPIPSLRPGSAVGQLPDLSDNEEEEGVRQESEMDSTPPQLYPFVIEPDILDDLIEEAGWVGHKQSRDTKTYDEIWVVKKPHSKAGPSIIAQLQRLSQAYKELRRSKTESSEAEVRAAQAKILERLGRLGQRTESTLTSLADVMQGSASADEATNEATDEETIKILVDLYFIVLPKWLECIKVAVEAYDEDGSMSLKSLEQMQKLLKLYCDLADAALQQSPQPIVADIIPKKNSNRRRQFRITQPTRDVLQEVRKIRRKFNSKIHAISRGEREIEKQEIEASREQLLTQHQERIQASRLEEAQAKRLENEEKRRADEETKFQIRNKQIGMRNKAIARDWARNNAEEAKIRARQRRRYGNKAQKAPEIVYSNNSYEEGGDFDDPFSEDYQSNYQRVKVFPSNNKHDTAVINWTDEEMEILIECMSMGSKDANRYEDAARLIGCSIERVFEGAKELQETYDRMHENGELNGEDDGFNYDVWTRTENV